ncbi:MAG: hypothetical protein ABH843_01470 [Candidatus Omnitrophota bacterium]
MRNRIPLYLFSVIFFSFMAISCAPTYPREKVIEGVKELCKREYSVDVEVKIEATTLGVRIPLEGLFDTESLQIAPEAFKKIDGVMLSVSRVALSSDKSIDFYTVITHDKNVPGAEVVITRHVGDLHRYVYGDISRGEFSKRMVFDVRFNPQGIIDTWLGEFSLEENKLDEFICQQASRRISDEFKENKMLMGKFNVVSCEGILKDNTFKFTTEISREGLPMSELIHGKAWHDKVLELCLKIISHTIYTYDFRSFEKIEVFNSFDNKTAEISNKEIRSWRKRKIEIE